MQQYRIRNGQNALEAGRITRVAAALWLKCYSNASFYDMKTICFYDMKII